jgi:hypothetical protein
VQKGHVVLCPGYFLGPIVGWMRCHGGCNCTVEVFTVAMAGTSRCLFENRDLHQLTTGDIGCLPPMGGWNSVGTLIRPLTSGRFYVLV